MNLALGHKTQNTKSFVCFSISFTFSAARHLLCCGSEGMGQWASGTVEGERERERDEPIEMPKRVCMVRLALHMGDTEVQSSLLSSALSSPESQKLQQVFGNTSVHYQKLRSAFANPDRTQTQLSQWNTRVASTHI